jgi:hypothetical protein
MNKKKQTKIWQNLQTTQRKKEKMTCCTT